MKSISYRCGYKYQLAAPYEAQTDIYPTEDIVTEYIQFFTDGRLFITRGYAWDGPSWPAIDTLNFMRGSLEHDAFYQLMRENKLDHDKYRDQADRRLQTVCLEDGMFRIRAWWVYMGVHLGAGPSAEPENDRKIITAP